MEDDFNTADAIAAIFELVKLANSTADENSTKAYVSYLKGMLEELCGVLGLITQKKEEALDSQVEEMIAAGRRPARRRILPWQIRSGPSCLRWASCWRTPERA